MVENIIGDTLVPRDKKEYLRVTDIKCPICNKEDLYVLSEISDSTTIECPRCRYQEHKPSNTVGPFTDLNGNPIKAPIS